VNGSYNILRKRKPNAFAHVDAKGIAAYVVCAQRGARSSAVREHSLTQAM
jgi:hypothetical protein